MDTGTSHLQNNLIPEVLHNQVVYLPLSKHINIKILILSSVNSYYSSSNKSSNSNKQEVLKKLTQQNCVRFSELFALAMK